MAMLNNQRVHAISWSLLVAAIAASVSAVPAAAGGAAARVVINLSRYFQIWSYIGSGPLSVPKSSG
jgi:hypothetical protein